MARFSSAEIERMYAGGMGAKAIGLALSSNQTTILRRLRTLGVTIRRQGRPTNIYLRETEQDRLRSHHPAVNGLAL